MNWLKSWWTNHVQKSIGMLMIALDSANLAIIQEYQQDIVQFFGHYGQTVYSAIRLGLGAVIVIRATQKKQASLPSPVTR
jgi:hypothetical protein